MSTRGTIAYGVVFAVLLAAYIATGRIEQRIEREQYEARKLFEFQTGDVRSLSIERKGDPPVEALRGDDKQWRIVAPYDHIPANGPLWDQLAAIAAGMTNERPIRQNASGLAAFDLDEPGLVVRIGTNAGELTQLAFGSIDPTRRHRYTVLGTSPEVFLTRAEAYHAFNRSLDDLRDRRVFPGAARGVDAVEIRLAAARDADGNVTQEYVERFTRDDSGVWWLDEPLRAHADQKSLNALADEIRLVQGTHYNDDPESLADFGLDNPYATLTAFAEGGAAGALAVGWANDAHEGTFFARLRNAASVFSVDAVLLKKIHSEPLEFRERHLFTGEAIKLERIVYRGRTPGGIQELELRYTPDKGWGLEKPAVTDSDQFRISLYVSTLKAIQGRRFPDDPSATGLDSPRLELSLFAEDRSSPTFVRVGDAVPDSDPLEFYAETDFGVVTTIGINDLRLLEATPFTFREKKVLPFEASDVRMLDLAIDGKRFAFVRTNDFWQVGEPANHRLESQSDVAELLQALSEVEAVGVVDPIPARDVMGLDEPVLIVTVHMPSYSAGPLTVGNLKASASRERFTEIAGKSDVYYLDQSLLDDVRELLRGVVPSQ